MSDSSAEILDVGHGSCALITSKKSVAVVDSPRKTPLLDLLEARSVYEIQMLFASHADEDHLSGLIAVLNDERYLVRELFINPEQGRATRVWNAFKVAVSEARKKGTVVHSSLNSTDPGTLTLEDVSLRVLAPTPIGTLAGPGGKVGDRGFTSNSLSAVILVCFDDFGRVLLSGDMTEESWREIQLEHAPLECDVVVFPHHGGRSSSDMTAFTENLLAVTRANLVVFSLGRKYRNPRPEVVRSIGLAVGVRLCCTGLSVHCAGVGLGGPVVQTCAGTVAIDLERGSWDQIQENEHERFVTLHVPLPLCRSVSVE